jgi:hypothetical protein
MATQDPTTKAGLVDLVCPVVDPSGAFVAISVTKVDDVGDIRDVERAMDLNRCVDGLEHRVRNDLAITCEVDGERLQTGSAVSSAPDVG